MVTLTRQRVEQLFDSFRGEKIFVIGDLMIDRYLRGRVSRLSPEAPVPVVEMDSETYHFGGAANVALNLQTLGCDPILIGLVGEDEYGRRFEQLLKDNNLSSEGIIFTRDRPTTVKTRIIGDNQHLARVDIERIVYSGEESEKKLLQRIKSLFPLGKAVILEDYNKGVLTERVIAETLSLAQVQEKISTVDPKFINFMAYRNPTVFKPNIRETSQALGKLLDDETKVEQAGFELLERLKAQSVLLTRGADGMSLFEQNRQVQHIATRTRKVADVSGAGDTVIATMTAALVGGANFREAATLANSAAGIVCEEVGIVAIQAERLKKVLLEQDRL